ncbi:MAG: EamA family transporter [Pseudomonadales bacterium]|nr:EamA family transporter [Pseudomonadales bacterium]
MCVTRPGATLSPCLNLFIDIDHSDQTMTTAVRNYPESNITLGALCMCAAMLGGSSIDVVVKALAGDYPTAQIVLLRSAFAIPIITFVVYQSVGLAALKYAGFRWQLWRGLLTAGANFGFFYGLGYVPLVMALMLAYISPVLIVLLAKPLLGEDIGPWRLCGVLVGFAGVLIVVQPDEFGMHPAVWAIIGSAVCWALLSISNRALAGKVSTPVLTFYTYPVALLLAALLTWGQWIEPVGWDWALFALAGFGSLIAHGFAALAYRYAAAGLIAPFEYTALIWISLAGFLFWGEVPSWAVWVGGVAVILGGYIALRAPA